MTKQEALEELKSHVRCADWTDEDYVDCVSKEALKVAIEALGREVSMKNNYFDGKIISAKEACDFAKFNHTKYPSEDQLVVFYENKENKELVDYVSKNILFAAKTKNWSVEAEFGGGIGEDRIVNIVAIFRNMGYSVEINLLPKKYVLNISWPIFIDEPDASGRS